MPGSPGRPNRPKAIRFRTLEALEGRSLPSGFSAGLPPSPLAPVVALPLGRHWEITVIRADPFSAASAGAAAGGGSSPGPVLDHVWASPPQSAVGSSVVYLVGDGLPARAPWPSRPTWAEHSLAFEPPGPFLSALARAVSSRDLAPRSDWSPDAPRAEYLAGLGLALDHWAHPDVSPSVVASLTSSGADALPGAASSALAMPSGPSDAPPPPAGDRGGEPGNLSPEAARSAVLAFLNGFRGDLSHGDPLPTTRGATPPPGGVPALAAVNGNNGAPPPGLAAAVLPAINGASGVPAAPGGGLARPVPPSIGQGPEVGPALALGVAHPEGGSAVPAVSGAEAGPVPHPVVWRGAGPSPGDPRGGAKDGRPGEPDGAGPVDEAVPTSLPTAAAELIASFSPFERGALEQSIDQFLGRLVELDTDLSHLGASANLVPGVLTTAALAAFAAEAVRRRLRRPWDDEEGALGGGGDHFGFPGLPGRPGRWALEDR